MTDHHQFQDGIAAADRAGTSPETQTMLNPLPKLKDRPGYVTMAGQLQALAELDAASTARLLEIEQVLAAVPVTEDPISVLTGQRPGDLAGLQSEHVELRSKRERIARASKLVAAGLQRMSDELAHDPAVIRPVLEVHAELAAEYLAALRTINTIKASERANLARLEAGGYGSGGLQLVVPVHVDWPGLLHEAGRDSCVLDARLAAMPAFALEAV